MFKTIIRKYTFSIFILVYNMISIIVVVTGFPVLLLYLLLSEKRRSSILTKSGLVLPDFIRNKNNKSKRTIWVHALSVGEVISAVPFIKVLKEKQINGKILFSTSTKTGYEVAISSFDTSYDIVESVFYAPFDLFFSVNRFINKINPDMVIIIESDIWPNFIYQLSNRNIPVYLVNARLSVNSYKGYQRYSFFFKPLFSLFYKICTQSDIDKNRFSGLGVPWDALVTTGNIKFDQEAEFLDNREKRIIREHLNVRNGSIVFIAGSTHGGEEIMLCDAYCSLRQRYPELILIIAPRNPKRSGDVYKIFKSRGFKVNVLNESSVSEKSTNPEIIIVDVIGILKKLYAIADLVFIGGSLTQDGGHNPLEAAAYGKPVIFGPYMSDFREISGLLVNSGGAVCVSCVKDIISTAGLIISDKSAASSMGKKAFEVFESSRGSIERTINEISDRRT
jgi:3-deoxy-D-manno-octulosonic-acid transferase